MTFEVKANPRHEKLAADILSKLEAMSPNVPEEVLDIRIVLRHGIARKVKWTREEEHCFP